MKKLDTGVNESPFDRRSSVPNLMKSKGPQTQKSSVSNKLMFARPGVNAKQASAAKKGGTVFDRLAHAPAALGRKSSDMSVN